jgi:hypothetical protein
MPITGARRPMGKRWSACSRCGATSGSGKGGSSSSTSQGGGYAGHAGSDPVYPAWSKEIYIEETSGGIDGLVDTMQKTHIGGRRTSPHPSHIKATPVEYLPCRPQLIYLFFI